MSQISITVAALRDLQLQALAGAVGHGDDPPRPGRRGRKRHGRPRNRLAPNQPGRGVEGDMDLGGVAVGAAADEDHVAAARRDLATRAISRLKLECIGVNVTGHLDDLQVV
jgi:hypothetical protein